MHLRLRTAKEQVTTVTRIEELHRIHARNDLHEDLYRKWTEDKVRDRVTTELLEPEKLEASRIHNVHRKSGEKCSTHHGTGAYHDVLIPKT